MQQIVPITVVIVGCYACGKTTLAKHLSQALGFEYYTEFGGELRANSACRSSQSCSIFDELVMFRELERDNVLLKAIEEKKNIVLEQWHIGNIAYAKVRNAQVAYEYLARIRAANTLQRFSPIVVFLDMNPEVITTRIVYDNTDQLEEDILFFSKWRQELEITFSELNILPVRIDATGPPSKVYDNMISKLSY